MFPSACLLFHHKVTLSLVSRSSILTLRIDCNIRVGIETLQLQYLSHQPDSHELTYVCVWLGVCSRVNSGFSTVANVTPDSSNSNQKMRDDMDKLNAMINNTPISTTISDPDKRNGSPRRALTMPSNRGRIHDGKNPKLPSNNRGIAAVFAPLCKSVNRG